MNFRTEVENNETFKIGYSDKILMLGSCFTEYIGAKFSRAKLNVLVNPLGIMFNPESIAATIDRAIDGAMVSPNELFCNNGLWCNYNFHGSFSSVDKTEAIQKMNLALNQASTIIKEATTLIITFGTAFVYKNIENNKVVANCHKVASTNFTRSRLTVESIVERYTELINKLLLINPKIQIVLTVSPVRHLRDGAHQNQLSKSVLLLATEQLTTQFNCVHYFPAYEIILDELRDYRFYETDMVHPSGQAVEYIWELFSQRHFTSADIALMQQIDKMQNAVDHRPINPKTNDFQTFIKRQKQILDQLSSQNPQIDFTNEKKHWEQMSKIAAI